VRGIHIYGEETGVPELLGGGKKFQDAWEADTHSIGFFHALTHHGE
jgi:hypothetical protein